MSSAGRAGKPLLVILRALGLGDLLTAVPALRALARAFPEHRRVLLAPRAYAELMQAAGAAEHLADTDFRGGAPTPEGLPALPRPDVAVNLHGRGPQSHEVLLGLRPARLLAYAQPRLGVAGPILDPASHEVDRWCDLLRYHGIPADPTDLRFDVPPLPAPCAPRSRCVVLHPGASSAARRWPLPRWAAVARAQRSLGRQVVVTGTAGERPLALELARLAGLPPAHVLAGELSLWELARLIAGATVVVSGDTGPAHLATAVGTRSVLLFGPTPPSRWGPRVGAGRHRVLWRGRTGDPHAPATDPGLLEITVPDVLAALSQAA